jgi:hypothetical protein
MLRRYRAWSGALTVMVITAVLVVLDLGDRSITRSRTCARRLLRCYQP